MDVDFAMLFFAMAHKQHVYIHQTNVNFKELQFWCGQQNETKVNNGGFLLPFTF